MANYIQTPLLTPEKMRGLDLFMSSGYILCRISRAQTIVNPAVEQLVAHFLIVAHPLPKTSLAVTPLRLTNGQRR